MTLRRIAYLIEVALAVFLGGTGATAIISALVFRLRYAGYDAGAACVKGAVLFVSAGGLSSAAWHLRGRNRPAWGKHWLSLLFAFGAIVGLIYWLRTERGPTPLTAAGQKAPASVQGAELK
jgi:hypothetical protein